MKRFHQLILATLLILLGCTLYVACSGPQVETVDRDTQALRTQLADLNARLEAQRQALQATTQPRTVTPAPTATNPAPEPVVVPPTAAAVKQEAAAESALDKTSALLAQATLLLTHVQNVTHAAATGDPGPAVAATAPLFGPYAPWVLLASTVLTTVWGAVANRQKNTQTTEKNAALSAAASVVDAVQNALAQGQLAVTSPQAAAAVDSIIDDHPASNRLFDVIAAAPVATTVTNNVRT